jgi:hypothetical protein
MPYYNQNMRILLALFLVFALGGCSSDDGPGVDTSLNPSGLYRSTAAVGGLGELELTLLKREGSANVYDAQLESDSNVEIDASLGTGSLGEDHLIINFEIGEPDDYYFQGFVQQSGTAITGLTGTFIFPDQAEQLAVEFERVGDAPATS